MNTQATESGTAIIRPARIPYNRAFDNKIIWTRGDNERRLTAADWKVLVESIFPGVGDPMSIIMAIDYCRARKLDIFKRPVFIVPMWNSTAKRTIDTIWLSFNEILTTAHRCQNYAGADLANVGGDIELRLTGKRYDDSAEETVTLRGPEWIQYTVYRLVQGFRCPFPGPKVFLREIYSRASSKTDLPNDRWTRATYSQLDKCAMAAALRRAFPEECGEYCAEEMDGKEFTSSPGAVTTFQPAGSLIGKTTQPLADKPPAIVDQTEAISLFQKLQSAIASASSGDELQRIEVEVNTLFDTGDLLADEAGDLRDLLFSRMN